MGAFPAARLRHSGVFRARPREITSLLQVLFKSVVNSAALSLTSAGKAPISEAQWGIYRVVGQPGGVVIDFSWVSLILEVLGTCWYYEPPKHFCLRF